MASSSGTATATATATAAAAAPNEDRNKPVTGYPIQSRIFTGYPHIPHPENAGRVAAVATFYTTDVHDPRRHQPPPTSIIFHITFALLTIFLLMMSVYIIFLQVFRPQFPEFQVTSASISTLNSTSPTWNLSILVKNPSRRLTLSYDRLQAAVAYDNYLISQVELPSFSQSKSNKTQFRAELAANVGNDVAREILNWRARRSVEFGVRLIGRVFGTVHWWFRSQMMVVYCPGLYLGFSPANPNGTLLNPNKECEVSV